MIKFHKLEKFNKARQPYVPKWVQEFCDVYAKTLTKKRKRIVLKIVDEVKVRGKMFSAIPIRLIQNSEPRIIVLMSTKLK